MPEPSEMPTVVGLCPDALVEPGHEMVERGELDARDERVLDLEAEVREAEARRRRELEAVLGEYPDNGAMYAIAQEALDGRFEGGGEHGA